MRDFFVPVLTALVIALGSGLIGFGLSRIDIGSCSHDMIPCRDAGARFIPPSL